MLTAVLLALVALFPAPAGAHTSLLSATPPPGGVAGRAPRALTLRFDEGVDASLAVVHVVGPDGRRVDAGPHAPAAGTTRTLRVGLRRGAAEGTYAVAYRILSDEDGHTIPGGFRFSIGRVGPPPPVSLDALIARVGPPPGTTAELDVARGIRDAGIVVVLGALIALLMVWRAALADVADPSPGWRRAAGDGSRALRRLVVGAGVAGAAGSLALVALQGASARGGGLRAALDGSGLSAVAGTRFGAVGLGAAALLAGIALAVWAGGRGRRAAPVPAGAGGRQWGAAAVPAGAGGWERGAVAVPAGADGWERGAVAAPARAARGDLRLAELGATGVAVPARPDVGLVLVAGVAVVLLPLVPVLTGHAAASDSDQAVPFGAVHVRGAGGWVGGVAALATALVAVRALDAAPRRALATALVARFAPWALGGVALIALTGVVQAIERLSALGDLTATAYGRALLVKAGLLLIVVGIAAEHGGGGAGRRRRGAVRAGEDVRAEEDARAGGTAPARAGDDPRPGGTASSDRSLRRLALELAGIAAILGTTAVLSGTPPPGAAAQSAANGSVSLDFHAARLEGALTPARSGVPATLAFGLVGRDGRAFTDLERVRVTLTPPAGSVPLATPTGPAAAGHPTPIVRTLPARADGSYRLDDLELPRAGRWRLAVALEIDRFITYRRVQAVPVG